MASQSGTDALRAKAGETAEATTGAFGEAGPAASEVAAQAGDRAAQASDAMGDLYAKGAASARNLVDELPASMSDAAAVGERLMLRGRQRLDHGVRNQPVEALLLAGAIGYLLGWATARN